MESISFLFTSMPAIFVLAPLLIIAVTLVVLIKKSGSTSAVPVTEAVAQVATTAVIATTAIAEIATAVAPTPAPEVVAVPTVEVTTPVVAAWRPAEPAPVADIQIEVAPVTIVTETPAPNAEIVVEPVAEVVQAVEAVPVQVTESAPVPAV